MADKPKREQVKDLIAEGVHTKAQIADNLSMSAASVSSQMTYLRWMGNNIIYSAEKILSFVTADEFTEWKDAQAATKKVKKVSTKAPADQLKAAEKSLKGAITALNNWEIRVEKTTAEDIEDFEEFTAESSANIVLLGIKIKRATARVEELTELVANTPEADAPMDTFDGSDDDVEDIDEDELL